MAFEYVKVITAPNGNNYVIRYDKETGTVETIVDGTAPLQNLTEEQLGVPFDGVIGEFCNGTTLHVVKAQTGFPYAYASQIADSQQCGFTPPPPPPPPPPAEPLNYGLVYRGTYSNTEQGDLEMNTALIEAVTIYIKDGQSLAAGVETQYVDIQMAGDPLHLTTIDNSEAKFTPIRATQATMQFLSTNQINADTFVEGADDRWFVEIIIREQVIFSGYLMTDEISEDFNTVYDNAVTLVATDHIGLLKDVPLVDFTGKVPRYTPESGGYYKVIEYIAWALNGTGLQLDIHLADNLFEESFPNLPAFDNVYLSPKTFEGSEIGTCEDSYTVLQKILKDEYFLCQHQNAWWICRIDEYEVRPFSYFRFNYKGEYQDRITDVDLARVIGQNPDDAVFYDMEHIEESTVKMYERAYKEIREVYNYNYPKEIIDNIDFSRGDWLTPVIVPNKTVEEKSYNGFAYRLEDWTAYKGAFGSTTAAQGSAYIIRYFFEDIERERYLELISNTEDEQFAQSNPVPVHALDRFDFSIDYRLSPKALILGTNNVFKIRLILQGIDGVTYILIGDYKEIILGNGDGVKWVPYTGQDGFRFYGSAGSTDEWVTIKPIDDLPPLPVEGNLFVLLPFSGDDYVHYNNLKFTYTPYINGGYAEYKGQRHKVGHIQGFRAVREEEVFISDAPKKLFKGALFKKNEAGAFVLAGKWYNGAVFPNPPDPIYFNTRGRTQAFTIWNQHNRTFRILDSKLDGLLTTGDVQGNGIPSCVHEWMHADSTPHTTNKLFLLLHYDMDFYLCSWTGYFMEVLDKGIDKEYASPYEFKYLKSS
jgi:hypothetical protein